MMGTSIVLILIIAQNPENERFFQKISFDSTSKTTFLSHLICRIPPTLIVSTSRPVHPPIPISDVIYLRPQTGITYRARDYFFCVSWNCDRFPIKKEVFNSIRDIESILYTSSVQRKKFRIPHPTTTVTKSGALTEC